MAELNEFDALNEITETPEATEPIETPIQFSIPPEQCP